MKVGDVLECLAILTAALTTYLATHLAWPPTATIALGLAWEAQCYSTHPVRLPRIPRPRLRRKAKA